MEYPEKQGKNKNCGSNWIDIAAGKLYDTNTNERLIKCKSIGRGEAAGQREETT